MAEPAGRVRLLCSQYPSVMSERTRAELKVLLERAERAVATSEALQRELKRALQEAREIEQKKIGRLLGDDQR